MAGTYSQAIIETATALGMDPLDLATVISYESGFRPDIWGGKGGQHFGSIQFGPNERRQYGVDTADIASQFGGQGAIAKYFRDRGYKPGMSLLDIYSIVNAGGPGLYNASDTAAGGAPGTVRDKVEQQMSGHRQKAQAYLAGSGTYDPRRDTPSSARPTSEKISRYADEHPVGPEGDVVTTSPYALPAPGTADNPLVVQAQDKNPFEKVGAAVGKIGTGSDRSTLGAMTPVPNPPLTSMPAMSSIDPASAQRQALAMQMAMQRLNSGQLFPSMGGMGGGAYG